MRARERARGGDCLGQNGERRQGSRLRAMVTTEMAGDGRNRPATVKAAGESRERVREGERGRVRSV